MNLTDQEIENMPAGPEMDALIAAEIFGAIPLTDVEWEMAQAVYLMNHGAQAFPLTCRFIKIPLNEPQYGTGLMFRLDWPRSYSRDEYGLSAVIVEKMRSDGWLFDICDYITTEDKVIRLAGFTKDLIRGEASADDDTLAVCRASLKAVRELKAVLEACRKIEMANA